MSRDIKQLKLAQIYPMYIDKVLRKGRFKEDVDTIITWLTGYTEEELQAQIDKDVTFETFFNEAPEIHKNAPKITGVICGVRVEEVEDPLVQNIRRLDKLVDELAKGKALDKILRV